MTPSQASDHLRWPSGAPTHLRLAEDIGIEVLEELGRGAHAVVYRARRGDQLYALKLLSGSGEPDLGATTRALCREAALVAGVDHPRLPRIHDVGEVSGCPYLVMDLVEGRPLAAVLAQGAMAPPDAVRTVLELTEAVAALHERDLVHRDVKPENVMITRSGVCLIDLGLVGRPAEEDATIGTIAYAAPEQSGMLRRPVDHRSDLYSVGVILFECLTGHRPFEHDDVAELLRMHASAPAPDVRSLVPAVPDTLALVTATLLAKNPDDRYQHADDLVTDLTHLLARPDTAFVPGGNRTEGAREAPLTGRVEELSLLRRRWGQARSGRGGAALIQVPAGSGKSSLARQVAAAARDGQTLVLSAKASPGDPRPLGPIRRAVEDVLAPLEQQPELRERWRGRIESAAGPALPLLAALSPSVERFIADDRADGGTRRQTSDQDGSERGDETIDAVAASLLGMAVETGGLLLLLDDVQWLDRSTLEVLARLAVDLPEVPFLVLATARDDVESQETAAAFLAVMGDVVDPAVSLDPLSEGAVTELVAAHVPGITHDSPLSRTLVSRGHGNPFLVLQYLQAVVDAGLLRPSWGTWILDEEELAALDLPDDALRLVLARMDGLGEEAQALLTTAAAVGSRFHPDLVAAACGIRGDRVRVALAEAEARRVIDALPSGEYAFLHDRIREALLSALDETALQKTHGRLAQALEEAETAGPGTVYAIADHLRQAGPGEDPDRVFRACLAAGRQALADGANALAVDLLEYAVGTGIEPDPRFHLWLGEALRREDRFEAARERLELALSAATDPVSRAEILLELGTVFRDTWDADGVLDCVRRGVAELGAPMPRIALVRVARGVALALAALLTVLTRVGVGTATGRRLRRHELITALHHLGGYAGTVSLRPGVTVLHNLYSAYSIMRMGHGVQYAVRQAGLGFVAGVGGLRRLATWCFRQAEGAAAALGSPRMVAMVHWYRGGAAYMSFEDDGEGWTRAVDEHDRWLDPGPVDDALASLCWDAAAAGRTAEALAVCERGQRRPRGLGARPVTSLVTLPAVCLSATGRSAEAAAELAEVRQMVRSHGGIGLRVNLVLAELFALIEQSEYGRPFDEVADSFTELGISPVAAIRPHRAYWMHLALGRVTQCRLAKGDEERRMRRAQADDAIRQLHRTARPAVVRAAELVARAERPVLAGRPERALRTLTRMPLVTPDAPVIAFEAACTRARALSALGHPEAAAREATTAQTVALERGWPHRALRVRREFDIDAPRGAPSQQGTTTSVGSGVERHRLQAVEAVSRAAARVVDPGALARIALDETLRILPAERALLFLVADGEHEAGDLPPLVPHLGRDLAGQDLAELTGYSVSIVERVAVTGQPVVMTGTDEGVALGAHSVLVHGLRSILAAPLQLDGRLLGVVYLDSHVAKGIFTADDVGILTALTDHVATSLETARAAQLEASVQAARQQRDLAERLNQALADMSAALEPDDVLHRLLIHAAPLAAQGKVCLVLVTGDDRVLRCLHQDGSITDRPLPTDAAVRGLLAVTDGTLGTVTDLPAAVAAHLHPATRWLGLGLSGGTARLGTLVVAAPEGEDGPAAWHDELGTLAAQAVAVHDRAALFAQVQSLAVRDELTGVPNRRHFAELAERDLAAARRHRRAAAVLIADIDHFKQVNDTHGHLVGDDVIREVAHRITTGLRAGDAFCRYGGEEFAVLLAEADRRTAHEVAESLRTAVSAMPITTRHGEVAVTISIGVAVLGPDEDLPTLLARADTALYQAKREGRDRTRGSGQ